MIDLIKILDLKPTFSYNKKAAQEQNILKGWIFFHEFPDKEIIIEIIHNKKLIDEFKNNNYREDVKLIHNHKNGFCGFYFDLNDINYSEKIEFNKIDLRIKGTNFYIKKEESKTIISFQNIYKKYKNKNKDFWVLNNINFAINKNDCVGIVGKNGQGKSTLLSLIGGVDKPDKGKIFKQGELSWPIGKAGGFQGSLTARENCTFVCKLYLGDQKNRVKELVDKIEEFADIGDYFDSPIKTYSSGMKSRISFALSIFMDFDIYLVDEITAVGDLSFRKKCQRKFEELKGKGTLIMATHNLEEIRRNCNKLIIVNQGQIKFYENVKEGLNYYRNMFLSI